MTKASSSSHEEIREKGEKGSMKGSGGLLYTTYLCVILSCGL